MVIIIYKVEIYILCFCMHKCCELKVEICLLTLFKDQPSEMPRASTTSLASGLARTPTAGTADVTYSKRVASLSNRTNTQEMLQNHPYGRGETKAKRNPSTHTLYIQYI